MHPESHTFRRSVEINAFSIMQKHKVQGGLYGLYLWCRGFNHWRRMQRHFDLASSLIQLHICGIEVIDVHPVLVIHFEPREISGCLSIARDE
jgi:hypothetical protein